MPEIAWHSLITSLDKADTPKNGWDGILIGAIAGRSVDKHIPHAYQASITSGIIDQNDRDWFAQRGPGDLVDHITIPTLIVQGTASCAITAYPPRWCGSAAATVCASPTPAIRRAFRPRRSPGSVAT